MVVLWTAMIWGLGAFAGMQYMNSKLIDVPDTISHNQESEMHVADTEIEKTVLCTLKTILRIIQSTK